ncbi:MAG: hypothetical protein COA78_16005 [Blastopirellula sp.]|nr:MAG: hypothetical protein COA78_16005 [Blastopirellula sp.]
MICPTKSLLHFTVLVLTFSIATLQEIQAVDFKTGTAFEKQLEVQVDIHWEGQTARAAMNRLSEVYELAIFLDRRIDPDQTFDLEISQTKLDIGLKLLARKLQCGVCYVGPVVYFGPVETTQILPTVVAIQSDYAKKLNVPLATSLSSPKQLSWPRLSQPRDLATQVAGSAGLSWIDLEKAVPHDLWMEQEFPKLTTTQQLSLLLAGFDLSYKFSDPQSNSPQLIPITMPKNVTLTRNYEFRGDIADAVKKIRDAYPEVSVEALEQGLQITGKYEAQQQIGRILRGVKVRRSTIVDSKQIFTMSIQQKPLGAVIASIAKKLKLTVSPAVGIEIELKQLVSFDVTKIELKELLDRTFEGTGLKYQLEDKQLTITK